MDLGLAKRRIWITGGHTSPWAIADTLLGEGAEVLILTTALKSPPNLRIRWGSQLEVLSLSQDKSLLNCATLAEAFRTGAPDTVIHLRCSEGKAGPTLHEWDEFLRRKARELGADANFVIVEDRAAGNPAPHDNDDCDGARVRLRTWSTLLQRPVSLVSVAAFNPCLLTEFDGSHAALVAFLAVRGRGRCAMVDESGSVQLI